jgi:hypothetical protein
VFGNDYASHDFVISDENVTPKSEILRWILSKPVTKRQKRFVRQFYFNQ